MTTVYVGCRECGENWDEHDREGEIYLCREPEPTVSFIRCGHCRRYHGAISDVRACSEGKAPKSVGTRPSR